MGRDHTVSGRIPALYALFAPGKQAYACCLTSSCGSILKHIPEHWTSERRQAQKVWEDRGLPGGPGGQTALFHAPWPLGERALSRKPSGPTMGDLMMSPLPGGSHMVVWFGDWTGASDEGLRGTSLDPGKKEHFSFLTRSCLSQTMPAELHLPRGQAS